MTCQRLRFIEVLLILSCMVSGLERKNTDNETGRDYDLMPFNQLGTLDEGPDVLNRMCERLPNENSSNPNPLQCYQCQSSMNDKSPQCDTKLFRYVRHSEKFRLRQRCNSMNGYFCVKTVFRKFGDRLTQRGCYGKNIEDVNGRKLVTADNFRKGCFSYRYKGYEATSCFCSTSLCNGASGLSSYWKKMKADKFKPVIAGAVTGVLWFLYFQLMLTIFALVNSDFPVLLFDY